MRKPHARLAATVIALAVGLVFAAEATAAPSPVASKVRAAAAPAGELRPANRFALPGGAVVYRFRQRVAGVNVLGGEAVVNDPPAAPPALVADQTKPAIEAPPTATVSRARAVTIATADVSRLRGRVAAGLAIQPGNGGTLVWRVLVPAARPLGDFEVLVDARSGQVVRRRNLIRDFRTGHAKLYNPNPVVERAPSGSLAGLFTDHHDRDTRLLTRLRRSVKLRKISSGQHCLRGEWAHAELGPDGREVCKRSLRWGGVKRSQDRFGALMVYFHITRAQRYLHRLGFSSSNSPKNGINDHPQVVVANAFPEDNSFFSPFNRRIEYGAGGVDDAEDADVILHEYGHAMQDAEAHDWLVGNGAEAGALQEGGADYWAAAMSSLSPHTANEDDVCIFDWDSVTYGDFFEKAPPYSTGRFCGRRADVTDALPEAESHSNPCHFDIHCVGQVWSSTLWDLRKAIGGETMDRIYLAAQAMFVSNQKFSGPSGAGEALVQADEDLNPPGTHVAAICSELAAREISAPSCP